MAKHLNSPRLQIGQLYCSAARPKLASRWWTADGLTVTFAGATPRTKRTGPTTIDELAVDVASGDLIEANDEPPPDGAVYRRGGKGEDSGSRWFRLGERVFTFTAGDADSSATPSCDYKLIDFTVAVIRGDLVAVAMASPSVAQIDPGDAVGTGLPASGGDTAGNPTQMPADPGMASATPSSADSTVKPEDDADGPASGDAGECGTDGLTPPLRHVSQSANMPHRPRAIDAMRAAIEAIRNDATLQPAFDAVYKAIDEASSNGLFTAYFPACLSQRERDLVGRVLTFDGYDVLYAYDIRFDHLLKEVRHAG